MKEETETVHWLEGVLSSERNMPLARHILVCLIEMDATTDREKRRFKPSSYHVVSKP